MRFNGFPSRLTAFKAGLYPCEEVQPSSSQSIMLTLEKSRKLVGKYIEPMEPLRLRMLQVGFLTCWSGIFLMYCQLNGSGFSTKGFNFQKNASKAHASPAQTVPPLDTLTALFFAINTLAPPCSWVFFKVSTMYLPFEYKKRPCDVACKAHNHQEWRTSPKASRILPELVVEHGLIITKSQVITKHSQASAT